MESGGLAEHKLILCSISATILKPKQCRFAKCLSYICDADFSLLCYQKIELVNKVKA